ncbi:MAG: hypothetical protein JWL76_2137 [Thermoleophilia bacterium]|nr:hypothetical protein [Thermoleophilia bacterium]
MTSTCTHRCVIGFDHEPKRGKPLRFEPNDPIVGLPTSVVKGLVEQGAAEPIAAEEPTDG